MSDSQVNGRGVLDVRSQEMLGVRDDFAARQVPVAGGDGDDGVRVQRQAMPRGLRVDVVRDGGPDEA